MTKSIVDDYEQIAKLMRKDEGPQERKPTIFCPTCKGLGKYTTGNFNTGFPEVKDCPHCTEPASKPALRGCPLCSDLGWELDHGSILNNAVRECRNCGNPQDLGPPAGTTATPRWNLPAPQAPAPHRKPAMSISDMLRQAGKAPPKQPCGACGGRGVFQHPADPTINLICRSCHGQGEI